MLNMKKVASVLLLLGLISFGVEAWRIRDYKLGPEYPQPDAPIVPIVDDSVYPRLGAASANLEFQDEDGTMYFGLLTSGGAAYLKLTGEFEFPDAQTIAHTATSEVSFFRPETNEFEFEFPNMKHKRAFHCAVTHDGSVFVFGGGYGLERFDVNSWKWVEDNFTSDPAAPVFGGACAVLAGDIYVVGGFHFENNQPVANNNVSVYNVATRTWTHHASNISPRVGSSLTALSDGRLVLFGGASLETSFALNDLLIWNQATKEFDAVTSQNEGPKVYFHAAYQYSNFLIVTLGERDSNDTEDYRNVFIFDFEALAGAEQWEVMYLWNHHNANPSVRSGFSHVFGKDRILYVFSGIRNTGFLGDSRSLQAEVWGLEYVQGFGLIRWARVRCYPGFAYDSVLNVCIQPWEPACELCKTCRDTGAMRRTYTAYLREKMLAKDYTGVLRQCPALWINDHWNHFTPTWQKWNKPRPQSK